MKTISAIGLLLLFASLSAVDSHAQSWRVLNGSGCSQVSGLNAPPTLSGPLTAGTFVRFDNLGGCTPYYVWEHGSVGPTFLLIGLPLAPAAWIFTNLWIREALETCQWAVSPVAAIVQAPVDSSLNYVPLTILIPNDSALVGVRVGVQPICRTVQEPYADYLGASPAVEIIIG